MMVLEPPSTLKSCSWTGNRLLTTRTLRPLCLPAATTGSTPPECTTRREPSAQLVFAGREAIRAGFSIVRAWARRRGGQLKCSLSWTWLAETLLTYDGPYERVSLGP